MDDKVREEIAGLTRDLFRIARQWADRDQTGDLAHVLDEHTAYEAARSALAKELVELLIEHAPRREVFALRDGTDITAFAIDLLLANDGWTEPTEERASLFLGKGRAEAVRVGCEINAIGGWRAMSGLNDLIGFLTNGVAARELSAAWSGIGEWQN